MCLAGRTVEEASHVLERLGWPSLQGAPETSVQPFRWGSRAWRRGPCVGRPKRCSGRGSGTWALGRLVPSIQKAAAPGAQASPGNSLESQSSPLFQVPCRGFFLDGGCPPWIVSPNGAPVAWEPDRVLRGYRPSSSGRRPCGPPVQDLGVGVGVIQGHTASS